MSANVVGNQQLDRFDVIVIGSGAGGAPVADILTRHGKKVLVIEAGANHFDGLDDPSGFVARHSNDEVKHYSRGMIAMDPLAEPRSYRKTEADGDRTFVGDVNNLPKTVGGGALHADLKMPRFAPDDFHLGTLLRDAFPGTAFADWPVDYDMLEPFYAFAERELGVQGKRGSDPFAGPMKNEYPMAPGLPMYCAALIEAGAQKVGGVDVFPYAMAVNSRPYGGRPACVDCGLCSGYPCPTNAKGSPLVTMLRRALLTGRCQMRAETRAVKLLSANGKHIDGVECIGPKGERETYRADAYVLAASPIEDARLLFLSGNIGNASGMVGRCLTFHYQTAVIGVWEERIHSHRGKAVSHGFSNYRGVPNDPTRPLGGIVEISGTAGPVQEASFYTDILKMLGGRFDGGRFKRLMTQSPARERLVVLVMQAEDAPQMSNRVDLDPSIRDLDGLPVPRITYQNHAFELDASAYYAPKMIELLGASGARWAFTAPADEISTSAHIMGTLRFGSDPKTSVCNAAGRFHDVDNLFASDGALFPTSSGYNPTHTIVALAVRVGAEIAFPGSPERALS